MQQGIVSGKLLQLGNETVNAGAKGTAVTTTALIRGQHSYEDQAEFVAPDEHIGFLQGANRVYQKKQLAAFAMESSAMSFEQLPYILAGGVRGRMTGIQDGAGSDYIYTYNSPGQQSDYQVVGTGIAFVLATSVITDTGSGFGFIAVGDTIEVSGSASNDGIYTVTAAAAGSITVDETLADESAGPTVSIFAITIAFTALVGDNQRTWQSPYCFPTDFELTGEGGGDNDAVMMAANWLGRGFTDLPAGFATISLQTVGEAIFSKSKLYIDTLAGTIGTTLKSGLMTSFSLTVETGVKQMFAANGQLFFADAFLRSGQVWECEITFQHVAAAKTEVDAWLAGTGRQIQIKLEGAALQTPGTTYSVKTVLIDLPGKWMSFPSLEDLDGSNVVTGTFRSAYDPTAGIGPGITVVNELSTLV